MVQMASAPQRKTNQRSSGVRVGERVQTASPSASPRTVQPMSAGFQSLMSSSMTAADAAIMPKKNPQVWTG